MNRIFTVALVFSSLFFVAGCGGGASDIEAPTNSASMTDAEKAAIKAEEEEMKKMEQQQLQAK